jgi:hypothetical protein
MDKVIEGTVNQVKAEMGLLPEDHQAEIIRRRLICATCPFNSSNAVGEGYITNRIDEHCIMCGCTITRKTASLLSNCGIDCCNATPNLECDCKKPNLKKYNVEHGINLDPKWTTYKPEDDE